MPFNSVLMIYLAGAFLIALISISSGLRVPSCNKDDAMSPVSSKQMNNAFTWKFWLLIALTSFSGGLYSIIGYGNYLEQHIHHFSLCLADEVVAFASVAAIVVGPPAGWLIA